MIARSARWRGDLVRAVAALPAEQVPDAAALIGFDVPAPAAERIVQGGWGGTESFGGAAVVVSHASAPQPMPFWRLEQMTFHDREAATVAEPDAKRLEGLDEDDLRSTPGALLATPKPRPLAPWSRLWPLLRVALLAFEAGRDPDVRALVRGWARGDLKRIPRNRRRAWAPRASVWVDRSRRLTPFFRDQDDVVRRLEKVCGKTGFQVRVMSELGGAREDLTTGYEPDAMTPVLALSDLGMYGSDADRSAWLRAARRLRLAGVRASALVPSPSARWDSVIAEAWSASTWERGAARERKAPQDPSFWSARSWNLLRLASAASVVQPGLLRELRVLLGKGADSATEADAWTDPAVRAADATGLVLRASACEKLRAEFADDALVPPELKERVSEAIRCWHEQLPRELLRAETLIWHAMVPAATAAPPGNLDEAKGFAARFARTLETGAGDATRAAALLDYGRAWLGAIPDAAYDSLPELKLIWGACFRGMNVRVPRPIDPASLLACLPKTERIQHWAVRQVGASLVLAMSPGPAWPSQSTAPGSPVAWLLARSADATVRYGDGPAQRIRLETGVQLPLRPREAIDIVSDTSAIVIAPWILETSWAKGAGRDRFGLWADAAVNGAPIRFRWIPPGRFDMGSPLNEEGRLEGEGPAHAVTWSRGRWLADAPVTQQLWNAVMGSNPSRFKSPDRPVECVSWEDCREFVGRVGDVAPELDARFPSEAEWEHACRAGTSTATWVGDLWILGENDAPVLNPIAWYGGNAGIEFELKNGYDTTMWPNKQFDHVKGGTHVIKRRKPNPFGLFDTLGNVYEWCADMFARYEEKDATDPSIVSVGSGRVFRGGSWGSYARYVRAASRRALAPGDLDVLGFRLARGQGPGQTVPKPSTRDATHRPKESKKVRP